MKTVIAVVLLVFASAVLFSGCTTPQAANLPGQSPGPGPAVSTPAAATPAPLPDLTGNWTGPAYGYADKKGFTDFGGELMTMRVTDQKDRLFSGQMFFRSRNGGTENETFAGVIGRDGTSLTIIEQNGGQDTGTVISPNEIELIFMNHAAPYSIAVDSLKRG